MLQKKMTQIKYLKKFEDIVFVHNKTNKKKFDDKSLLNSLIAYDPNGYKKFDKGKWTRCSI